MKGHAGVFCWYSNSVHSGMSKLASDGVLIGECREIGKKVRIERIKNVGKQISDHGWCNNL